MTTKRRDIAEVIAQVLLLVPQKETELRSALDKIRQDASYRAPEDAPWGALARVLTAHLGEPTKQWHEQVSRIMRADERTEPAGVSARALTLPEGTGVRSGVRAEATEPRRKQPKG